MTDSQQTTMRAYKLASEAYTEMKRSGRFFVKVSTYTHPVNVSIHVAAQNAEGWRLENERYRPIGNSASALVLLNVGFTFSEKEFVSQ